MNNASTVAEPATILRSTPAKPVYARSESLPIKARSAAVPAARRTIAHVLRAWGLQDSEAMASVELVVSELVTNALRHAGGPDRGIMVLLRTRADGLLRLGVVDNDPGIPTVRCASPSAESGRGLTIAETLTAERGGAITVERHEDGGKTVWADFPAVLATTDTNHTH
ncbi:ATP-binding protein [Streptomyces sp. NPDC048279]|uniref:ATP-binding protein n=1 Tax=Streptomyces sp. NPDC048279 TaxID=3154714 RepID=UPI00342A535D